MGTDIDKTQFDANDFEQYHHRLNENLCAFRQLLSQPGFGQGSPSFGAELELYIIDKQAAPKAINQQIHQQMMDKQLTLELNRFNLEYNFTPVRQEARPFSKMKQQMDAALTCLSEIAATHQARIVPIGILPTLQVSDMGLNAITDVPRYHVLAKALRDKRGSDFHIHIEGVESLDLHWGDVSPEGANTSFQFHYRVNPENFADAYNAAQLSTPLALALSANSPFFLGKKLWHETRIALFKQSIDYRLEDALHKHLPARVLFGLGWIRKDIYEMYAEGVYLFEPLMPICSDTNSFDELRAGIAPSLSELRLHQGSIWNWNRPIYDPTDKGHLRIELRALPAGPTPGNMLANAALMSGLIRGLQSHISTLLPGLPFRYAEQNFYRAAKYGLNAVLFWPSFKTGTLEERPVTAILKQLLPLAEQGLNDLGVDENEIKTQINIIKGGLETRMNGAQWQISMFDKLLPKSQHSASSQRAGLKQQAQQHERQAALAELVELYYTQYQSGKAVHEWSEKR